MRILYLSHIDWGWIKQRPQFVAEYLTANDISCSVYYQKSLNFRNMTAFKTVGYQARPFWKVPLKNRNRFLLNANKLIQRFLLRLAILKVKPDALWVTHPEFYEILPPRTRLPVIYDCMDDIVAFYSHGSWIAEHFAEAERNLAHRAQHVFFSSEHLANTVLARAGTGVPCSIVRNAYNPRRQLMEPEGALSGPNLKRPEKLAYFGTIASWLDLETLMYCCKEHPNVRIDLFGPLESKDLVASLPPAIRYMGVLPHAELRENADRYDVLIMPFVVNELIKSVDPVKLYEYIDFDKPIISVFYEEIRRFGEFVNFYRTPQEFSDLLRRSCDELKKSPRSRRSEFLRANTWDERVKKMKEVLLAL